MEETKARAIARRAAWRLIGNEARSILKELDDKMSHEESEQPKPENPVDPVDTPAGRPAPIPECATPGASEKPGAPRGDPAVNGESLDAFRKALAARHNEINTFMESDDFKKVGFLEQELMRIQRDGIRSVLVAANLQSLYITRECITRDALPKED